MISAASNVICYSFTRTAPTIKNWKLETTVTEFWKPTTHFLCNMQKFVKKHKLVNFCKILAILIRHCWACSIIVVLTKSMKQKFTWIRSSFRPTLLLNPNMLDYKNFRSYSPFSMLVLLASPFADYKVLRSLPEQKYKDF